MKLYAISDLHLDFPANRQALTEMPAFPGDWLITAGDLCTTETHLRQALEVLCAKFAKVFWVPGNHELWSSRRSREDETLDHGHNKYMSLVRACREFGVHTPEDPFVDWPGSHRTQVIAPLFIPYDYSFRPPEVPIEEAVPWAMEAGILCSDEKLINTQPFASMSDWCRARFEYSIGRLDELPSEKEIILVNHYPLRADLVRLRRIPRFIIWCGTRLTEDLPRRYPIKVAISGHLHMRATDYREGVRFEEVSLGYPRDWDQNKGVHYFLREILPGPAWTEYENAGPFWHFY